MSTPPDTPADADADAGAAHQGDTGTRVPPRYAGPMLLASALTNFTRGDSTFRRDGPRADVEYRDFGWAGASSGVIGAKHIRAIRPFDAETGWHWHDMTGHFIYVLRGWLRFRYAGIDDAVFRINPLIEWAERDEQQGAPDPGEAGEEAPAG